MHIFPWSVRASVKELSIGDNALIEPVKTEKKLLAYGDSITQGYIALRPSSMYTSKLADFLNAEYLSANFKIPIQAL